MQGHDLSRMPMFVLTNDDGIDAPGIQAMRDALALITDESAMMVAPQDHLSGCSHQITTHRKLTIEERSPQAIAVDGMPADCVRLAVTQLCPSVRMVLSGINAGGNMGADIPISGTVAAIREAAYLRIPAIAISHYIHQKRLINWDLATKLAAKVLKTLLAEPWQPGDFWNVNLPHLQPGDPDPAIVTCPSSTQPLPVAYERVGNQFRYVGRYGERQTDAGSDVEICFQGNIAASKLRLW